MNGKNYVKDHGMILIIWALQAGIVESILWMFHVKLPVQIFVFHLFLSADSSIL